ncbi:Uncharacterized protein TCM_017799 [Theobroma cacao]|uniref:Uncharacterized protein n=1 Tax=Theobroma cacao TaxID=3641 RepID=A0A061ELM7_THECC|nr:Uncharacterized protein TCM_017799 [Theobroma cacao]
MFRRDGSSDTPHSASEGSLDSTAKSQWRPNLGCGVGAARVSKEEYIRIQQVWIKDKMGKSHEGEKDLEEDPSMCSNQGDDDPNGA